MNKNLQYIIDFIKNAEHLSENEKADLTKLVKNADKDLTISEFKLERTEKVKKTTVILLEETIEELEQKRKAVEEQKRELEIEAALERVRTVAMGMHKSEDLLKICEVAYKEFKNLGFDDLRNAVIHIPNDEQKFFMDYDYSEFTGGDIAKIEYGSHPIVDEYLEKIRSAEDAYFEVVISKDQLRGWKKFRKSSGQSDDSRLDEADALYYYLFSIGIGDIGISTFKPINDSQIKILKRFRNVFDLAYRRYTDIAKAEAQAREAEIQLALERVRARTMAMQHSDELEEASQLLDEQVRSLGIETWGCAFHIYGEENSEPPVWDMEWFSSQAGILTPYKTPREKIFKKYYDIGKEGKELHIEEIGEDKIIEHYEYLKSLPIIGDSLKEAFDSGVPVPKSQIDHVAYFGQGHLLFITYKPVPEAHNIFKRFAKEFEQTYTRFLDLQKAEAQAREAQIEAALERVRSLAVGMQNSDEVAKVSDALFKELQKLSVNVLGSSIVVIDEKEDKMELWRARTATIIKAFEKASFNNSMNIVKKHLPQWFPKFYSALEERKNHLIEEMSSNTRLQFINSIAEQYNYSEKEKSKLFEVTPEKISAHFLFFKLGYLALLTEEKLPDENLAIARRFIEAFAFAYTRFLDIKKAEAQAREAVKQASLDRVRGEIASMRTSEDLNRITPVIWRELKALEVPFIRCGVFIVNEEKENVHVYLSTPDGKALGVLGLAFDANELTSNTVEYWRKKEVYKEHWNKEEFINWTKSMMELGQVQNAETYQGSSTPPESLNLHFVPFTQGMLYVGDVSPLADEKLDLVKTLAEAFSIAYARYEDFKHLEEAKNKIELTLSELKSAQTQLVHSEKMASLGELTAGIAHEIKNPLNFVNNFSEISGELLDEVKEELEKNDKEEVLAILEDLKQNLEKINQHGKRADSIVKGMLLHSRGTAGEKILTDINDLLDQYVNLAYHGMRATNKEFNITIEKDYDESIEKINVVPQDISRVFLNIINNACYAAYDKKKESGNNNFSPTLKVSTKNQKDKVEIRIGDNGNGISKDILDKIFQPFFTTKPTGEGTGLGLSLSYDIVTKMHNGELKVESREGKYTEFVIIIPK